MAQNTTDQFVEEGVALNLLHNRETSLIETKARDEKVDIRDNIKSNAKMYEKVNSRKVQRHFP